MNDANFKWDAFLSHAEADKDVVRDIANRLKSDGVQVWFDEWEIRPGDSPVDVYARWMTSPDNPMAACG